jgi:hypothetical protein
VTALADRSAAPLDGGCRPLIDSAAALELLNAVIVERAEHSGASDLSLPASCLTRPASTQLKRWRSPV